jgi:hypothetical protein
MFDGADKPADPDWKAIAQLVMQQRDRAEVKANNLEIDLAMAQQREARLAEEYGPKAMQAIAKEALESCLRATEGNPTVDSIRGNIGALMHEVESGRDYRDFRAKSEAA